MTDFEHSYLSRQELLKRLDLSKLNTLEGYESPVTLYFEQIASEIEQRRENEIVAKISERMGVDIDKRELERALSYERDQYSRGYRAGYAKAMETIQTEVAEVLRILKSIMPEDEQEEDHEDSQI